MVLHTNKFTYLAQFVMTFLLLHLKRLQLDEIFYNTFYFLNIYNYFFKSYCLEMFFYHIIKNLDNYCSFFD